MWETTFDGQNDQNRLSRNNISERKHFRLSAIIVVYLSFFLLSGTNNVRITDFCFLDYENHFPRIRLKSEFLGKTLNLDDFDNPSLVIAFLGYAGISSDPQKRVVDIVDISTGIPVEDLDRFGRALCLAVSGEKLPNWHFLHNLRQSHAPPISPEIANLFSDAFRDGNRTETDLAELFGELF